MKTASGKRPAAKADSTRQREAACGAVLDALRRTLGASGDEWEAARAADPRVTQVSATYADLTRRIAVANTAGTMVGGHRHLSRADGTPANSSRIGVNNPV